MTISITIQRSSVVSDLRSRSHAEAAAISDAEERYIVEAGTEKMEIINQCVTDAFAEVSALLRQFLTGESTASANDSYQSSGDLALSVDVSSRRSSGLARPLTDAVHKYAVNSAMAKFYNSVSRPEMSAIHEKYLQADIANINSLLYFKHEATY